jgi:hypothetical protein
MTPGGAHRAFMWDAGCQQDVYTEMGSTTCLRIYKVKSP